MKARIYVHGIASYHPPAAISNKFLESLDIGVDRDWVKENVGILSRRTVLDLNYIRSTKNADPRAAREASFCSNAVMGALALKRALAKAKLRSSDVRLLIAGGCSPQYTIPSEAALIAAQAGIECAAFDLSASCTSFGYQIAMLGGMRPDALPDFVAIVQTESMTASVDYTDRSTAVIWGDCATAAIVSSRVPSRIRISDVAIGSDPSGATLITTAAGGHFRQQGRAVQRFAARRTEQLFRELIDSETKPTAFIGHQANLRMLETVCRRLDVSLEQHLSNVARFGNTGAAGAPSVLADAVDSRPPGVIAIALVGAGLSWARLRCEVA